MNFKANLETKRLSDAVVISDEKIQGHMRTLEEILQNQDFAPLHGIVQEVNGRLTLQSKLCSKVQNGDWNNCSSCYPMQGILW